MPTENFAQRTWRVATTWNAQYSLFTEWLDIVISEIVALNCLNDSYGKGWTNQQFSESDSEAIFSADEQKIVIGKLIEFKQRISLDERINASAKENISKNVDSLIAETPHITKGQFLAKLWGIVRPAIISIGYNIVANFICDAGKPLLP